MVTANNQGMKINGVILYPPTFIFVVHLYPTCTGMPSTSVKPVYASK